MGINTRLLNYPWKGINILAEEHQREHRFEHCGLQAKAAAYIAAAKDLFPALLAILGAHSIQLSSAGSCPSSNTYKTPFISVCLHATREDLSSGWVDQSGRYVVAPTLRHALVVHEVTMLLPGICLPAVIGSHVQLLTSQLRRTDTTQAAKGRRMQTLSPMTGQGSL